QVARDHLFPAGAGHADARLLAVEVRIAPERDEDLTRTALALAAGDADRARLELVRRELRRQRWQRRAAIAVTAGIAKLRHEAGPRAVNGLAVEEAALEQLMHARGRERRVARIEREPEQPGVGVEQPVLWRAQRGGGLWHSGLLTRRRTA